MAVKLIPEITVRNGKVIEPGTGRMLEAAPLLRSIESEMSGYEEETVFYIIDEDGMEKNRFDIDLIERLGEEFRIWLKGGFRRAEFLMDALVLGTELAVMDSRTLMSLEELEKAVSMSDSVAFSLEMDFKSGWNRVPQTPEELAPILNSLPLNSIILTCEREKIMPPSIFQRKLFSHGCGKIEGSDGMILPYNLILLRHQKD